MKQFPCVIRAPQTQTRLFIYFFLTSDLFSESNTLPKKTELITKPSNFTICLCAISYVG